MPLQNRVTPFGDILAIPQRGIFTGNRGIIHDPQTKTLLTRRWTTKAWLVCLCEFRGRRRIVMNGRSWTELFFLDEATALAAGHRPCFYCRRDAARRFRAAFAEGNGFKTLSAKNLDIILHEERLDGRRKRIHPLDESADRLPDGAMVARGDQAYLIKTGQAWRWTKEGYVRASDPKVGTGFGTNPMLNEREASLAFDGLITPPSTLNAIRAGYRPIC